MKLSEKHYKSIIAEAMDEFAMLEKGRKDHPEDDNDHKKQGQKDTVSKSDQQLIRRKIKNKQGRNIINVTAIADELPYTQSMINRCINGKVHNGTEGEVEYKMPTDMARGIEAYLKRQVAEGKVSSIMKQVLREWSESEMTADEVIKELNDFAKKVIKSPRSLSYEVLDGRDNNNVADYLLKLHINGDERVLAIGINIDKSNGLTWDFVNFNNMNTEGSFVNELNDYIRQEPDSPVASLFRDFMYEIVTDDLQDNGDIHCDPEKGWSRTEKLEEARRVSRIARQVLNEMNDLIGTTIELESPTLLKGRPFNGNAYFMSGYQDPSVKGQLWAAHFEDNVGTCLTRLTDKNSNPIVYPEYAGQSCRLKGTTLTFTQD